MGTSGWSDTAQRTRGLWVRRSVLEPSHIIVAITHTRDTMLTHDLHHQVLTHQFQLTREQAMEWQEDCHGQTKSCMQVTSDILWIAIRSSFLRVQCRRRQSQEGPWGRDVRVSTPFLSCSTVFWSWSLV